LTGGVGSFVRPGEEALPGWLLSAMKSDREALLRGDAMRSFLFMLVIFLAIILDLNRRVSSVAFSVVLILCVTIDLFAFDKQYFGKEKYRRAADEAVTMTDADRVIKSDTSYYRVYNLQDPLNEANTSYFHHSLGGYHGAKIRRYQDLFDSCVVAETNKLITDAQSGGFDFRTYGVINMLNAKYVKYGPGADNVLRNDFACGPAWLVGTVRSVNSPSEELLALRTIDTRNEAVIDASKYKVESLTAADSSATNSIRVINHGPRRLSYSAEVSEKRLAVFSEIYYPTGWSATIDGKPADILRVNYVLRGLWLEPGKHQIEFLFDPASYLIGNRVTQVFNWLVLLAFAGSVMLVWRGKD
ncbi:MAG: YfhO family protein, partial [Bacteroidota bacterium]